jgi:hypothetical protein
MKTTTKTPNSFFLMGTNGKISIAQKKRKINQGEGEATKTLNSFGLHPVFKHSFFKLNQVLCV